MMRVVDSTDKKHIGEMVDETSNPIVFADGEKMSIDIRLNDNMVLANSNYIITLEKE